MPDIAELLLTLAREEFGQLTATDEKLFRAVATGNVADYKTGLILLDDPANADQWADERTLQADRIKWLCTTDRPKNLVTNTGIQITGPKITGSLALDYVSVEFPLCFSQSTFDELVSLRQTKLATLELEGSHVVSIDATRMQVEGSVCLRSGFQAQGTVCLNGVKILGDLDCNGGKFLKNGSDALTALSANVAGHVLLGKHLQANGTVDLTDITVGGNLNCMDGAFSNAGDYALVARGAKVGGNVYLSDGFKVNGAVALYAANIGRNLDCHGGRFITDKTKCVLSVERGNVGGYVFLNKVVKPDKSVERFTAEGMVNLMGVKVGGNLECVGGRFSSEMLSNISDPLGTGPVAIEAEGIDVKGAVLLRDDFKSEGAVRLYAATIGDNLRCDGAHFSNPKGIALDAERARLGGSVLLGKHERPGETVKHFSARGALIFRGARIGGAFKMLNIELADKITKLDLRFAAVATLDHAKDSWTQKKCLWLTGLVYSALGENFPTGKKELVEWLRLQQTDSFSLQPYEQLAQVLRSLGDDSAASHVLISQRDDLRSFGDLSPLGKFWNRVLGIAIGHGYRPHLALLGMVGFVLLGTILFGYGYKHGMMSRVNIIPSNKAALQDYPKFNNIVYSLDTFLPIIDLKQKNYWLPNGNEGYEIIYQPLHYRERLGGLLRLYLWIHTLFGWALTTLWVAGFTGLVRKLR